ncbi:MAG: VOC family protein [Actinomycetota bacterium]|nr:VOC family protein [Actinomycetota bacterium]
MENGAIVNHVGQCVADLDRSIRFYTELLGFEVDRTLELPDAAVSTLLSIEPPVGLRAVYLRRGEFQLELMQFDREGNPSFTERAFNEPGLTHLSVCVEDLDDARARVADLGGAVVTDLGGVVMVRDPDGQLLELLPMSFRSQRHSL